MKAKATNKRWMTTQEAAEYTGFSAETLKKWRYEDRGPIYSKPAGICMYDVADLDSFMTQGRRIPSVRASKERTRNVAV